MSFKSLMQSLLGLVVPRNSMGGGIVSFLKFFKAEVHHAFA